MSTDLDNELDDELTEDIVVDNIKQTIISTLGENSMSIREVENANPEIPSSAIQQAISQMFLSSQLKKCRVGDKILFSVNQNTNINNISNSEESEDINNENADYHAVSKLARKFRTCRYEVERDFSSSSGLTYPLKVTKKDTSYYIQYFSGFSEHDKDIFGKILKDDNSIRVVVSDEMVKLEVAKAFETFVDDEWGEDGYNEFRKNHGFYILTMNQFFKKTTWKNLVMQ